MSTVIKKESHQIYTDNSMSNDEQKTKIREALKKAVGYNLLDSNLNKEYKSEMHHWEKVPFEGNIHAGIGKSLDTEEIGKRYKKSTQGVWWILTNSMIVFVRRITHL